ncbi:MAG: hypothetical protein ONA90_11575 [candidate division KSB1 bacterium]|nr:hypothetical protein [candidate division KSB1 bacterium]
MIKRLSVVCLIVLAIGCAALYTDTRFHEALHKEIHADNWQAAIAVVEKAKKKGAYPDKDRLLYFLDLGMLYHGAGEYERSNQYLEQAERAMEELFTASLSKAALSMMLNDNSLEYRGEDYEDIYVNLFKALNYIALGQNDEALVEIRRIDLKLRLLTDKYGRLAEEMNKLEDNRIDFTVQPANFHNDALGRYLGALLYFYDGKYDDARIDIEHYHRALVTQPQIYAKPAWNFSLNALDTTLLHVMAFTGTAPEKTATIFRVLTGKNYLLVFPESKGQSFAQRFVWNGLDEGFYFKFALPELQRRGSQVKFIDVHANGQYLGTLQPIEDMSRVAEVAFERHKSLIYLKSIVRTVLKGLAGQKAKEEFAGEEEEKKEEQKKEKKADQDKKEKTEEKKTGRGKFAKWLFAAVVDVVTEISEQADLRAWRTMPGVAHTGYFPLAEGTYDIRIRFLDAGGHPISQKFFSRVPIRRWRLNMVEAVFLR